MSNYIKHSVPKIELLAGLAEECSELAQAALKLRRVLDPEQNNPTPMKEEEAFEDLYEEVADVKLYCSMLDLNPKYISDLMGQKLTRWENRLMSREKSANNAPVVKIERMELLRECVRQIINNRIELYHIENPPYPLSTMRDRTRQAIRNVVFDIGHKKGTYCIPEIWDIFKIKCRTDSCDRSVHNWYIQFDADLWDKGWEEVLKNEGKLK